MTHAAAAARAFEKTLEELGRQPDSPDLGDPVALGRRAALLAVSEAVWGKALGPLYDVEQVKVLLEVGSRQAVSDLAKRGRLLALDASGGRKLYPAFQFGPDGRPYPEMAQVLKAFTGAIESFYTIASWFVTPQDLLEGETGAAWMRSRRDPERLIKAACRAAAPLAR